MTTPARAAICRGNAEPFKIEDVELDDLRPDELRVRVVACGVCHTDMAVRDEVQLIHPSISKALD